MLSLGITPTLKINTVDGRAAVGTFHVTDIFLKDYITQSVHQEVTAKVAEGIFPPISWGVLGVYVTQACLVPDLLRLFENPNAAPRTIKHFKTGMQAVNMPGDFLPYPFTF